MAGRRKWVEQGEDEISNLRDCKGSEEGPHGGAVVRAAASQQVSSYSPKTCMLRSIRDSRYDPESEVCVCMCCDLVTPVTLLGIKWVKR